MEHKNMFKRLLSFVVVFTMLFSSFAILAVPVAAEIEGYWSEEDAGIDDGGSYHPKHAWGYVFDIAEVDATAVVGERNIIITSMDAYLACTGNFQYLTHAYFAPTGEANEYAITELLLYPGTVNGTKLKTAAKVVEAGLVTAEDFADGKFILLSASAASKPMYTEDGTLQYANWEQKVAVWGLGNTIGAKVTLNNVNLSVAGVCENGTMTVEDKPVVVEAVNVALNKPYTTSDVYPAGSDATYPDEDGKSLTDGVAAVEDATYSSPLWTGFHYTTGSTVVVNLEGAYALDKVVVAAGANLGAGINVPASINVRYSMDNATWVDAGSADFAATEEKTAYATIEFKEAVIARYVEYTVNKGNGNWIFVSEVEAYGEKAVLPYDGKLTIKYTGEAQVIGDMDAAIETLTDGDFALNAQAWGGNTKGVVLVQNLAATDKSKRDAIDLIWEFDNTPAPYNTVKYGLYSSVESMVGYPTEEDIYVSNDGVEWISVWDEIGYGETIPDAYATFEENATAPGTVIAEIKFRNSQTYKFVKLCLRFPESPFTEANGYGGEGNPAKPRWEFFGLTEVMVFSNKEVSNVVTDFNPGETWETYGGTNGSYVYNNAAAYAVADKNEAIDAWKHIAFAPVDENGNYKVVAIRRGADAAEAYLEFPEGGFIWVAKRAASSGTPGKAAYETINGMQVGQIYTFKGFDIANEIVATDATVVRNKATTLENLVLGNSYTTDVNTQSGSYVDTDNKELTDGIYLTHKELIDAPHASYKDPSWFNLACGNYDREAVIDIALGDGESVYNLSEIVMYIAGDRIGSGVEEYKKIEAFYTVDGETYEAFGTYNYVGSADSYIVEVVIASEAPVEAKAIRVICYPKDGKNMCFIAELEAYGEKAPEKPVISGWGADESVMTDGYTGVGEITGWEGNNDKLHGFSNNLLVGAEYEFDINFEETKFDGITLYTLDYANGGVMLPEAVTFVVNGVEYEATITPNKDGIATITAEFEAVTASEVVVKVVMGESPYTFAIFNMFTELEVNEYVEVVDPNKETITVDGNLNDTGWNEKNWIEVNGGNGYWQAIPTTDTLSYKYQLRADGTKLYVAVEIDCALVEGGNGAGTNVRFWLNTNDEATVYTHFYDVFVKNGELAYNAKVNTELAANKAANIENSSIKTAIVTEGDVTYVEFSVDLAEFNGTEGFNYFMCVSNKVNENVCLYYPVVAEGETGRLVNLPYQNWYFENDATVVTADIVLGDIPVYGTEENPDTIEIFSGFRGFAGEGYAELEGGKEYYWNILVPVDGNLNVQFMAIDSEYEGYSVAYSLNGGELYDSYNWGNPGLDNLKAGDVVTLYIKVSEDAPAVSVTAMVSLDAVGSNTNPEVITEAGDKSTVIADDDRDGGHTYSYTAPADGTITVTIADNNTTGWLYSVSCIEKNVYGDLHYSDDDTIVTSESIEVAKGDVVTIAIATYGGYSPAGTINWTLKFEETKPDVVDIKVSHLNLYNWGGFEAMLISGDGKTVEEVITQKPIYWIVYTVENIDGKYVATNFLKNSEECYQVKVPTGGFLLYVYSENSAYAAVDEGALLGYTIVLNGIKLDDKFAIDTSVNSPKTINAYAPGVEIPEPPVTSQVVNGFNVGHYSEGSENSNGAYIFTDAEKYGDGSKFAWWRHVAFAPVEGEEGVYTATAITYGDGGASGGLTIPEGGFVWVAFEWPESGSGQYALNVMNTIFVGDKVKFTGLDIANCKTTADATAEKVVEPVDPNAPTNVALDKKYEISGIGNRDSYYGNVTDGIAVMNLGDNKNAEWFGFYHNGNNPTNAPDKLGYFIIDLEKVYDVSSIKVGLVKNDSWGIAAPESVKAYGSVDGVEYKELGSFTYEMTDGVGIWTEISTEAQAQYIKIEVKLAGTFAFVNEVEVYGKEAEVVDPNGGKLTIEVSSNDKIIGMTAEEAAALLTDGDWALNAEPWGGNTNGVVLFQNLNATNVNAWGKVDLIWEFNDTPDDYNHIRLGLYSSVESMIGYPSEDDIYFSNDGIEWIGGYSTDSIGYGETIPDAYATFESDPTKPGTVIADLKIRNPQNYKYVRIELCFPKSPFTVDNGYTSETAKPRWEFFGVTEFEISYVEPSSIITDFNPAEYWEARAGRNGAFGYTNAAAYEAACGNFLTWWKHVAFAPVAGQENVYEVVAIRNYGDNNAFLEFPEGGFIWTAYCDAVNGRPGKDALDLFATMNVGDTYEFTGFDIAGEFVQKDATIEKWTAPVVDTTVTVTPNWNFKYAAGETAILVPWTMGSTLESILDKEYEWFNFAVLAYDEGLGTYVVVEVYEGTHVKLSKDPNGSDFGSLEIPEYGFILGAHSDYAAMHEEILKLKKGDVVYIYGTDLANATIETALTDAVVTTKAIEGKQAFKPEIKPVEKPVISGWGAAVDVMTDGYTGLGEMTGWENNNDKIYGFSNNLLVGAEYDFVIKFTEAKIDGITLYALDYANGGVMLPEAVTFVVNGVEYKATITPNENGIATIVAEFEAVTASEVTVKVVMGESPYTFGIFNMFTELEVNEVVAPPVEPDVELGNVNGKDGIDKYDYILVKRQIMNTIDLSDEQLAAADVNKDGTIDKYDYILIKRHIMGTYEIKNDTKA